MGHIKLQVKYLSTVNVVTGYSVIPKLLTTLSKTQYLVLYICYVPNELMQYSIPIHQSFKHHECMCVCCLNLIVDSRWIRKLKR